LDCCWQHSQRTLVAFAFEVFQFLLVGEQVIGKVGGTDPDLGDDAVSTDLPPVLQADFSTVGLGFNWSCVRPRDVACLTPRAGMPFEKQGPNRFREL
jgi:hypothetical protein